MNKFENPQDIINKNVLANEEKIAPRENAKIVQEQFSEIKSDIVKLKTLQKEISNKIDKHIDKLSGNTIDDTDQYPEGMSLRGLQAESNSVSLKIEDKIKELELIFGAMDKVKNLSQLSTKN